MEKTTEAMARIHQTAEAFIASCGNLSKILEVLPILEIGHDFIVKPNFTSGTRLERMSVDHGERYDHPHSEEVLARLDEAVVYVRQCCANDSLKDILLKTIEVGSRHVFWSTKTGKFIVPDLVITEQQARGFNPDGVR
jgi:hypothetical protein